MVFQANPKQGRNNIIDTICLGDKIINRVDCAKCLGIHIDDGLEWDRHIEYVAKKVASGAYALNSTKRILPINTQKMIYHSLVHSHLMYGALIWTAAFKYRLHKLDILQKRCIRNICNVAYNEHTLPLFKKLGILKIQDIRNTQLGKLMYMCTNDQAPSPIREIFRTNAEIHHYETRQRNAPHVISRSSNKISKTFIHECPKFWLQLPNSVKLANSLSSFKNRLKKHIIGQY